MLRSLKRNQRAAWEAAPTLIPRSNLTHLGEQFGHANDAMRDGVNLGLRGALEEQKPRNGLRVGALALGVTVDTVNGGMVPRCL